MRKLLLFSFLVTSVIFLGGNKVNAQLSGDSLIWRTTQSGYDTISSPVSGIYYMGSISYTNQITFLSLKVTGQVDTSMVPAIYNTTTIGYMKFNTVSQKWIFNPSGSLSFPIDTTRISLTFKDTATIPNTLTLQLKFLTIDTIPPVADSLKTTFSQTLAHNYAAPVAGVYNLGNFNETDSLKSFKLKITDYNFDTSTVYTSGSFSMPLHFNGTYWVASGIPMMLPVGNDSLIAIFKDKSNNNISINIKFIVIDNIPPLGGKFVWNTINIGKDSLLGSFDTINSAIATYTITHAGVNNDEVTLTVDDGTVNPVTLGSHTCSGAESTTTIATALKNAINALTGTHGYKATVTGAAIKVTAPTGTGVLGNSYIPHYVLSGNSTVSITLTVSNTFSGGFSTHLYNLGNICHTDKFITLDLTLNEADPDTNKVPLVYSRNNIGWMFYNITNKHWKCNVTTSFPSFSNGTDTIFAKFYDKAVPAHSITLLFKFTIGGVVPHVNLGKDTIICTSNSYTIDAGSGPDGYLWSTGATTETFVASRTSLGGYGVHTVYCTIWKIGCTGSDTVKITVNPTPTISVFPPSKTVCSGDTVILHASGANSYIWSGNSQYNFPGDSAIVTPILPPGGLIPIIVTGTTNGCSGNKTSNITANPIPNIGLGPDISITKNNDFYIGLTTGRYHYLWSTGATTSNLYIIGDSLNFGTNSIWVQVTDTVNYCIKSDTIVITVNHGAGINSESDKNYVKIYPNPSDGNVNLEIENSNNEKISIEIFDILGNKVFYKDFENNFGVAESINFSNNLKGVYFAKVFINNKIIVKKLIIN